MAFHFRCPGGAPAPAAAPRRTMLHVRSELVRTNAFYCRSCPTGCARAKCLAGLGDANGQAPLAWCVTCLTGRARTAAGISRP